MKKYRMILTVLLLILCLTACGSVPLAPLQPLPDDSSAPEVSAPAEPPAPPVSAPSEPPAPPVSAPSETPVTPQEPEPPEASEVPAEPAEPETAPDGDKEETATDEDESAATPQMPEHSPLYLPGVEIDDVLQYFNEVCLDAEMVNGGDATLLQRWDIPIRYQLSGSMTEDDKAVLERFTAWLNTVEGFPGISPTQDPAEANLRIYFCTAPELISRMGDNFYGLDGAVTFWYLENAIYDEIICIRTDLEQTVRNSVIQEEIYNGLGPVQDTDLRADSIIFSGYSEPQDLTEIDRLLIRLLYHPELACGMNAAECEAVIRRLYY